MKRLLFSRKLDWTVSKVITALLLLGLPGTGCNKEPSGSNPFFEKILNPEPVRDDRVQVDMVRVEGGTFTMGDPGELGSDFYDEERPAHSATLSTFYIGKYEVTQGQWKEVMGNTIGQQRDLVNPDYSLRGEGDNYPMYYVSWNDIVGTSGASTVINGITYYANGFIYKLNQMTGKKYRLPTEAEWEFAARGGNSSRGFKYSGSNTVDDVAWYYNNSGSTSHPVGTKAANELGIFDMSGNVWEWCSDWFDYYSSSFQTNPQGPSTGLYRVNRGGHWSMQNPRYTCVSSRGYDPPDARYSSHGFRLASSSN